MPTSSPDTLDLLRRGLLALLALGCGGALTELILLEHYLELPQLIPLVLLSLTLVTIVTHWLAQGRISLRALQVLGILLVIGGTVGVLMHFDLNIDLEKEANPDSTGAAFWLGGFRGDAPALAPGTLVQFGLIALLYGYRHPALKRLGTSEVA